MYFDLCLKNYEKKQNDTSDSQRINRAINDCGDGVLFIEKGEYLIDEPIVITNGCCLMLHKSATLKAVKKMDFIITIDCEHSKDEHDFMGEAKEINLNLNQFFSGGVLDGNGLASCIKLIRYRHFRINQTALLNGKQYGLFAGGYYELICNDIYCKCTMNGLSGNTGIYTDNGDSHYTDCIIVDYTTGMAIMGGGSNRLTRCHIWGGPVKALDGEATPEMLKNSVSFHISSEQTILRDCYADTAVIGYLIEKDARLLGCSYFNNDYFGLDNITAIMQTGGELLVCDSTFVKTAEHNELYVCKGGSSKWSNNIFKGGFKEIK